MNSSVDIWIFIFIFDIMKRYSRIIKFHIGWSLQKYYIILWNAKYYETCTKHQIFRIWRCSQFLYGVINTKVLELTTYLNRRVERGGSHRNNIYHKCTSLINYAKHDQLMDLISRVGLAIRIGPGFPDLWFLCLHKIMKSSSTGEFVGPF